MSVLFIHGEGHVEHWLALALAARRQIAELSPDRALAGNGHPNPSLSAVLGSEALSSSLVLHLTDHFLPADLERAPVITACLLVDVFVGVHSRLRWAMLFDYVFVAHPQFVGVFQAAGHPNVHCLPLAAPSSYLVGPNDDSNRYYDIGWVGRSQSPLFTARARMLPRLARKFHMNDWRRWHNYDEAAYVFQHSKVVVNIPRDDYPGDANMRVFEAMAAGALLVTRMPTELSELGFREGEHFVGYRDEADLEGFLSEYIARREDRLRIAERGRDLVRQEHTYDHRVQRILELIEQNGARNLAPARNWPADEVSLAYLHFHCASRSLKFAVQAMVRLLRSGKGSSLRSIPLIAKTLVHPVRNALSRREHELSSPPDEKDLVK